MDDDFGDVCGRAGARVDVGSITILNEVRQMIWTASMLGARTSWSVLSAKCEAGLKSTGAGKVCGRGRPRSQHQRLAAHRRLRALVLFLVLIPISVMAQSALPSPAPSPEQDEQKKAARDPVENADEFKSKLTFGVYFTKDAQAYDLNLRRQFGALSAWIAGDED